MSSQLAKNIIESDFTDIYETLHQKGPDYVIPTEDIRTWDSVGAVKVEDDPSLPTISIISFFTNIVKNNPNNLALVYHKNGHELKWTYSEYLNDVRIAAKGFIKLGLIPFHGVCMLGFNSPEWLISHLATIFAGGFAAGIYTSNSPASCFHVLNDSDANIIVVENDKQLQKILEIRDKLPQLKTIIQYTGTPTHPDVLTWDDLMLIGQTVPDRVLEKRIRGLATNQCCCLIYTSGTTGNAKGVMLSHDNLQIMANVVINKFCDTNVSQHRLLSYLPLSHLAALGTDVYVAIHRVATVYFASPDALKGKLVDELVAVKPTIIIAVPRMLEKMYEKMQLAEKSISGIKKQIFNWAKHQALKYHLEYRHQSSSKPKKLSLAKKLVLNKLKNQIGFSQMKSFICGGAPMAAELKKYFLSLDIFITEVYGLSESTSIQIGTLKTLKTENFEAVGNVQSIPEYKLKIQNPDEKGNGEILIKGRNVCMGYLNLEKATKETIDDERWLHSGDVGRLDGNGNLYITGRIKEILITAGGENIPPVYIEDIIKMNLPIISNCMVIGDKRNYLTILITLKTELDMETFLPIDQLTEEAISWCESVGSEAKSLADILSSNDKNVMDAIQAGITKYNNESAISNAQKIQKFIILLQDFSIGNGELGPTAKLRRPIIIKKFAEEIEQMYST